MLHLFFTPRGAAQPLQWLDGPFPSPIAYALLRLLQYNTTLTVLPNYFRQRACSGVYVVVRLIESQGLRWEEPRGGVRFCF